MNKATGTTATQPILDEQIQGKTHLTVAATFKDPQTGALYVHEDLVKVQEPYAEEAHIKPMNVTEKFGDVESWANYVRGYGGEESTHLTWNATGLRAVIDYADQVDMKPGRCQWVAVMPFRPSTQWVAWMALASNQPMGQKAAVERLEDLALDIIEPLPGDLMGLLRSLRATVNAEADTELRPDGTTHVAFKRDTRVQTERAIDLPSSFAIAIPVLKGHVDDDGRPVVYRLEVRIRASVDDAPKLTLRFAVPTAERTLEDVYADRVAKAKALVGDGFSLLRAADDNR